MTSAAVVTRTTRSPRRRLPKGPAAWERAGALFGMLGATVLVLAMVYLSSTPSVSSSPAAVGHHLAGHYAGATAAASMIAMAAILLVPFLASVRTFTSRHSELSQWRWSITVVTGAVAVTMLLLAGSLLAAAALLAQRSTAEDAAFAVFVGAKLGATLALLPMAALLLANARTVASSQRPERWLARFDIEIATMAVVASVASFINHDWIGPGAPITAAAWLLVALWVLALGDTMARGESRRTVLVLTREEGAPQ